MHLTSASVMGFEQTRIKPWCTEKIMVKVLADIITEKSYKRKQMIFTFILFNKYYDDLKVPCVRSTYPLSL